MPPVHASTCMCWPPTERPPSTWQKKMGMTSLRLCCAADAGAHQQEQHALQDVQSSAHHVEHLVTVRLQDHVLVQQALMRAGTHSKRIMLYIQLTHGYTTQGCTGELRCRTTA